MGSLKINNDLFLGKEELNRMQKFMTELGYKRFLQIISTSFGIVDNKMSPNLGMFAVTGRSEGFSVEANSFAVDSNMNLIYNKEQVSIPIPNDSVYYWVKISYDYKNFEEGSVSISNDGALSGNGTKFSEVLRGSPNYPSRIRLYSLGIDGEYSNLIGEAEVSSIQSDTSAFINLYSQYETSLRYAVVGTFTPGVVVPEGSKLIFQYDSVKFELIPELVTNTPPVKDDDEFYIARVRNSSGSVSISPKIEEFWNINVGGESISNIYYLGDPVKNNSWRVRMNGNNLEFQRRESGNWVTKQTMP